MLSVRSWTWIIPHSSDRSVLLVNRTNIQNTEIRVKRSLQRSGQDRRNLKLSEFLDSRYMKVARLSSLCTVRLHPPGDTRGTHFCYTLRRPQGSIAAGRIKFYDTEDQFRSQGILCGSCGGPSSTKKIYIRQFFPVHADIRWVTVDDG
jgi:hypothetical protein